VPKRSQKLANKEVDRSLGISATPQKSKPGSVKQKREHKQVFGGAVDESKIKDKRVSKKPKRLIEEFVKV
jgi:hypothetical protein